MDERKDEGKLRCYLPFGLGLIDGNMHDVNEEQASERASEREDGMTTAHLTMLYSILI